MTLTQFRTSSVLTAAMGEIMSNPTMKQALEIIRNDAILRAPPPAVPGVHQDTVTAHHVYRQFGVLSVIDTLERMTREGKELEAEEVEYADVEKQFQPFEIKAQKP